MKKIDLPWGRHSPKHLPSLRNSIMLYFALFVVFIIALLWLFQTVLLDDFYSVYKRMQVQRVADVMVRNIRDEDFSLLAEHLANQNDLCVLLLDSRRKPLVSAEGQRKCILHRMNSRSLDWWIDSARASGKPLVELFDTQPATPGFNPRHFQGPMPFQEPDQSRSMIYVQRVALADGTEGTLLLNAIITPVYSTMDALRYQLRWISGIMFVAAVGIAFFLSRRLSRPIEDTGKAARLLARSRYEPPQRANQYREIAELNATLQHAAEELSKVETLQHELIANISHDLRTPLTMIGGYAEMMRDLPGESTPENMQVIMDETSRLTTLVNELLDFSRLQSGSIPMTPTVFDLTGAVDAIIQRIGKLTEKEGYVILFEPEAHLSVLADETRIVQVIYNLIGNALTYAGEDKTVTLHQQVKEQQVRISVQDHGKGIPADELPLIWNRYYRTKETHKRAVVGSGLGLNIVRAILEQHHAAYGVDSTAGEGTTFWFELPLSNKEG